MPLRHARPHLWNVHELSITQALVDLVRKKAPDNMKVDEIVIDVGALTGLSVDSIGFYFEGLTRDGELTGARLVCRPVAARVRCQGCGSVYEPEDFIMMCPSCQTLGGEVLAGNELNLVHLEGSQRV